MRSWGEVLQRELRVDLDETRSEMVRVCAIAYLGCLLTAVISLGPPWSAPWQVGPALVAAMAASTASLLWIFRRRVPLWLLITQAPYAAVLLALGLWACGVSGASTLSFFYALVALYGAFFFRARAAVFAIGFCLLALTAGVIAAGDPQWASRVAAVSGVMVTVALSAGSLIQRVHERAVRDALTGLINRRMWESLVQQELNRAERDKKPVSIVLIDLDGFKKVNDRYGHLYGDDVLRRVAETLRRTTREADAACRWGGDEFALLLTDCDSDQVDVAIERFRKELDEGLTFSVGTATWRPGLSATTLFHRADTNLYTAKAKRAGK